MPSTAGKRIPAARVTAISTMRRSRAPSWKAGTAFLIADTVDEEIASRTRWASDCAFETNEEHPDCCSR